jgi:hypothetical protein
MRTLNLIVATNIVAAVLGAQSNPVPLVNDPLSPSSTAPGGPGFTLTVTGTGFVAGSVVNWNGSPRATVFASSSKLTASVPQTDIASAGTSSVTVVNPGPGGGASNSLPFQVTSAIAEVAFTASSPQAVGLTNGIGTIATADIKGDGKIDLIVIGLYNTYVLFGNGDGTFGTPVPLNFSGTSLAMGDFNHDGNLDLAIGDCCAGTPMYILLGNGDGTFSAGPNYSADAFSLAAADVNGDGNLDLIFSGESGEYETGVSVMLGNGDGTFQQPISFSVPNYPEASSLAVGDFNGDGRLDLAIGTEGAIAIALGNGDGTFQSGTSIAGASALLLTADFNGDGILDLAAFTSNTTCQDSAQDVVILLGKGDGTFNQAGSYAAGECSDSLLAADFNGDGKLDLAFTDSRLSAVGFETYSFVSAIGLLLGNGDGTFQQAQTTGGQASANLLAAGDFTGRGRPDLATASDASTTVGIDLQNTVYISPSMVVFGAQALNSTASQQVSVKNLGSAPLHITGVALSGANAADFGIVHDGCQGATLAPFYTCDVDVGFTPNILGPLSAFLTFTDSAALGKTSAALTGSGTPMKLTPAGLNFGSVAVGSSSAQKAITATNTTTSPVQIGGIKVVGADPLEFLVSNTCGTVLRPGQGCSIVVQFAPTTTGNQTAAVAFYIKEEQVDNPQHVQLVGDGTQ